MIRRPRLLWYLLTFLAILAGITVLTPWRNLDWYLFDLLPQEEAPRLVDEIVAISIPWDADLATDRGRITSLLRFLASGSVGRPRIVMLDVQILPDTAGLEDLANAVLSLQEAGTAVYAAVNPINPLGGINPDYMKEHARHLYNDVLDGFGHTLIQRLSGTAKYEPYLDLGGGMSIPALPIKIAEDFFHRPVESPEQHIILQVGGHEDFQRQAYSFEAGRLQPLSPQGVAKPDLRDHVVIVGNVRSGTEQSGPELLAWALSARISTSDNRTVAELLAEPWLLLGLVAMFSGLACLVCWLVLLRFPALRRRAPYLAPVSGGMASLLAMLLVVWLLLKLKHAYPQLTLEAVGIVLASGLAWDYLRREMLWAASVARPVAGVKEIDVFISYSRTHDSHTAWVENCIVEPLKQHVRRPDGSPLKVFFDKESIKPGDFWQERVAQDVNSCRVFVPIYSDDYFSKAVCNFEIRQALKKHMTQGGCIVPVLRSGGSVPSPYDEINYIDAAKDPNFIGKLIDQVAQVIAAKETTSLRGLATSMDVD